MKVVLINPALEMNSRRWFPLGIGYIASVLLEDGFDVEIVDVIGENLTQEQFRERIERIDARCFGIGGIVTAFNNVVDAARIVREVHPGAFLFAGNTAAYTVPELLLENSEIDAIVLGEGETATLELMQCIRDEASYSEVAGIAFKDAAGQFVRTGKRDLIKGVDALPFPAWHLLPIESYFKNTKHRYCVISTVRGCPYSCVYCCKTFIGSKVRYRSAESIVEELEAFHAAYSIDRFFFFDDLSTINKKRILKFCDLKMSGPLAPMKWTISARVNNIDEEIARALKRAKCHDIGFGLESYDQATLDSINKRTTLEQIDKALAICNKYRLNFQGSSFMVGYVGQTEEEMRRSSAFCRRHKIRYEPHFMTPYPGTELYRNALERGLIRDELEYLTQLSRRGNTNYLLVNLTNDFTDEALERLRRKYLYLPQPRLTRRVEKYCSKVVKRCLSYLRPARVGDAIGDVLVRKGPVAYLKNEAREINAIFRQPVAYEGSFERYSNLWS